MVKQMRKLLVFAMIIMLDVAVGPAACHRGGADHELPSPIEYTEAPTQTVGQEDTDSPAVTSEPVITAEPGTEDDTETTDNPDGESAGAADKADEAETIDVNDYKNVLGSWYMYSSEIEGYEALAAEENNNCCVTFYEDMTATLVSEVYYEPGEEPDRYENAGAVRDMGESSNMGKWLVEFDVEDCTYYYSLKEDGRLVQICDVVYAYEEYEALSVSYFVREQQAFAPPVPVVPESVQAIMDGATDNNWITVICDPDEQMVAELDEGNWILHDESDNEWLDYPITKPVELVVCNTSDSIVDIQIHEPGMDYDPTSEEYEWVRGPFMYWANLKPGEIARFVVNMADTPREATMAMYFTFYNEDNEDCFYFRVYRYDDPYLYF